MMKYLLIFFASIFVFPIAFAVDVGPATAFTTATSDITGVVGKPIDIPITVTNNGFVTDNYTTKISSTFPPQYILIDRGEIVVENVPSGDSRQANLRIFLLFTTGVTQPIQINITTTSLVSKFFNQEISKSNIVNVRTGITSLSDFTALGLLQIAVLSTILFYIFMRRLKL